MTTFERMARRLKLETAVLRAVVFLFLFSLALGAANLIFTARQVNTVRTVQSSSARSAASILQLCYLDNAARHRQVLLWEHLVTITAAETARSSPAQRHHLMVTERSLLIYVDQVFAPRNCAARFQAH